MPVATIDEVLVQLDEIIKWSKAKQSPIGYFATLYRNMTSAVKSGISNNTFTNPLRMQELDVIFANRYLDAWDAYVNKKPCTNAWCAAFDATANHKLIVLQHLILGINTHINLDLGIAAATCCPGDKIYDLQADFNRINDIINTLTQNVQDTLCKVWFPLRFINKISDKQQDAVINFSIRAARQASWANALALAGAQGQARTNYINLVDNGVVALAKKVINPGWYTTMLLQPVRAMEDKNVSKVIDLLR